MGSAVLLIGGCAVMCGVGFATSTALEWFNSVEIKPNKKKSTTKEDSGNDNVSNLRKKLESQR